jgi:hypothetical protein
LRCAEIINVDEASARNKKLIRFHAVSFTTGACALSAVKFGGISEPRYRKYQGHTECIPIAIVAHTGVYHSSRLCTTIETPTIQFVL